jgi:TolA-binding protein
MKRFVTTFAAILLGLTMCLPVASQEAPQIDTKQIKRDAKERNKEAKRMQKEAHKEEGDQLKQAQQQRRDAEKQVKRDRTQEQKKQEKQQLKDAKKQGTALHDPEEPKVKKKNKGKKTSSDAAPN